MSGYAFGKLFSTSEYKNGMITFLPYILLKLFPDLKIEQLLWLPVCVAGLFAFLLS